MKWVNEKPTRPGWWWYRVKADDRRYEPKPIKVIKHKTLGILLSEMREDPDDQWSDEPIPTPEEE